MEELKKKINEIDEKVTDQKIMLIELKSMFKHQQDVLEEHQRRSMASENRLDVVEKEVIKHLSFFKGAIWLFGGFFTFLTIVISFFKLFK